jgi:hypothetical protein
MEEHQNTDPFKFIIYRGKLRAPPKAQRVADCCKVRR